MAFASLLLMLIEKSLTVRRLKITNEPALEPIRTGLIKNKARFTLWIRMSSPSPLPGTQDIFSRGNPPYTSYLPNIPPIKPRVPFLSQSALHLPDNIETIYTRLFPFSCT